MTVDEQVTSELRGYFQGWLDAAMAHDEDWFERHLADEFRYLNSGGGALDKAGTLTI